MMYRIVGGVVRPDETRLSLVYALDAARKDLTT